MPEHGGLGKRNNLFISTIIWTLVEHRGTPRSGLRLRRYPIRARHIRYYEDRYFGPVDQARKGKVLPTIQGSGSAGRLAPVGKLSGLTASAGPADAEVFGAAARVFQEIADSAKRTRKVPARV